VADKERASLGFERLFFAVIVAESHPEESMQHLISLNVWSRIKVVLDQSRTKTAAIAYVTTDAIVQFGAGDVLVTDASDNAIACGETSARVLEAAIAAGAEIYTCGGLHAKVIVFDDVAVIGSANLSERSERDLVEAAWVTDDPTVVAEARSFVARLAAQSRRIDRALLQRILSIKVARRLPTLSKRDQNLALDETGADRETTAPPPAVDKELATEAVPQPAAPVLPSPSQPEPPDPEVARVLSRPVVKGAVAWVLDPQLVLMDRDDVRKLAGRSPKDSIGQKVWARKSRTRNSPTNPQVHTASRLPNSDQCLGCTR
jgi:hypothetical protein